MAAESSLRAKWEALAATEELTIFCTQWELSKDFRWGNDVIRAGVGATERLRTQPLKHWPAGTMIHGKWEVTFLDMLLHLLSSPQEKDRWPGTKKHSDLWGWAHHGLKITER